MEIKFCADAPAVNQALEVIRIIEPPAITQDGETGFLFVVGKKADRKDDGTPGPEDGKDFCWVYSRDGFRVARAEFPIREVDGEGPFIFPAANIGGFAYAQGEVEFHITNEKDKHSVQFSFANAKGKAKTQHPSFDPSLLSTIDKKLSESTGSHRYKTEILRQAISMSKPFIADENSHTTKEEHKVVNIYDSTTDKGKGGDGVLHAADGWRAFYFDCDDFKGKGLQIHSQHMKTIESFLNKCGPDVELRVGKDMIFALSFPGYDRVLGWSKHVKPPLDYKYPPKNWDKIVLNVAKEPLIQQLGFIESQLQKGWDKIRVEYEYPANLLTFRIADHGDAVSLPIDVTPLLGSEERSYAYDVTLGKFRELIRETKGVQVELRMWPMTPQNGQKELAGFRTIDEFFLNGEGKVVGGSGANPEPGMYKCTVTRFMSSRN